MYCFPLQWPQNLFGLGDNSNHEVRIRCYFIRKMKSTLSWHFFVISGDSDSAFFSVIYNIFWDTLGCPHKFRPNELLTTWKNRQHGYGLNDCNIWDFWFLIKWNWGRTWIHSHVAELIHLNMCLNLTSGDDCSMRSALLPNMVLSQFIWYYKLEQLSIRHQQDSHQQSNVNDSVINYNHIHPLFLELMAPRTICLNLMDKVTIALT